MKRHIGKRIIRKAARRISRTISHRFRKFSSRFGRSIAHRMRRIGLGARTGLKLAFTNPNPGLGLGVFGLNPHASARSFGRRVRIVGYRKGKHTRISPFSLTAAPKLRGFAINPKHHKRRVSTMKHRRSHRSHRRYHNPFSLKGIIPKSIFGKEMLTTVVGGTVGYFGVKKLPAMLPASWGVSGNTWQAWVAKLAILFAGNYAIGSLFKKPALAKSFVTGGAIAILTEVLVMNIPQLAGTGYFMTPQRQLAGGLGNVPGVPVRGQIVTKSPMQQNRY